MRRPVQAVTLFLSSPQDASAVERNAVVESVVKLVDQAKNVAIKTIHWKENIPGGVAGRDGQSRIDQEIDGVIDIYFGCMGLKYGAGTEQEFTNAIRGHIQNGRPREVLFAFDATPVNPFEIPDNFQKTKAFMKKLQDDREFGRAILYFCYSNIEEFRHMFFTNLNAAVDKATSRISGGLPNFR